MFDRIEYLRSIKFFSFSISTVYTTNLFSTLSTEVHTSSREVLDSCLTKKKKSKKLQDLLIQFIAILYNK